MGVYYKNNATQAEAPGVRGIPPTSHYVENLTCCAMNAPSGMMGMGGGSTSHVTVGTLGGGHGAGMSGDLSLPHLLQLDPFSGLRMLRAVGLPAEAGVTAMERG